jgi:hypothetical protein
MAKTRSSNQEIESLVSDFANQVSIVMRRSALEQVLAALGGDGAPVKRGPGRPRGSTNVAKRGPGRPAGSKNKRGKRTTEGVAEMGERLLSYVKSKPGLRADQIAKVFHTDSKTIRLPMQRLIALKKIKTKGQRRGMSYFVR